MTTQAQITTKADVKTLEGKEVSKYNAIRHGILRKTLVEEELPEAEEIKTYLFCEYEPKTITEELLIETMIMSYIRRQRALVDEGKRWSMYKTFDLVNTNDTDRYMTTSERQFYRALHELQRVQALRKGFRPSSIAVDVMSDSLRTE